MENVKGSKKKKKNLTDMDKSMMITKRKTGVWGEVEEGIGGLNGDGRRLDMGW